jgi:peptide/nickel transport system substrate-binding protein
VLGVLLVGTLAAAACGGDDGGSSTEEAAPETSDGGAQGDGSGASPCAEEHVGGTVTFGLFTEPNGLDPLIQTARGTFGGTELTAVYDTLTRYNPETGEYEPRVAESVEPNDDFTEWTVTLREGVQFGNGDPLTADVVKFSFERHTAEDSPSTWRGLLSRNLESIEAVDDRTAIFHLANPWADFPSLLGTSAGMPVNPGVLEEGGPEALQVPPAAAGVGPFSVVRYAPDEEIVMVRNDNYWGGQVCLDQIRFVRVPGALATYDAFRNGELDVAFLRDPKMIAEARADDVELYSSLVNGGGQLLLNNGAHDRTPPTTDVRIRQAIAYAIDPEVINDRVYEGTGLPTSAIIYEDSMLYQGLEGPDYDPERARELVDEAKADGQWDGVIDVTLNNAPESVELGIVLEALLEDAGFDARVDASRDGDEVIAQVVTEADYEMTSWSLSVSDSSPWPELVERVDNNVYTGYDNPDMVAALDELREAATLDAKKEALAKVQDIWNQTVPGVIYAAVEDVVVSADRVKGLVPTHYSIMYFDDVYLEE